MFDVLVFSMEPPATPEVMSTRGRKKKRLAEAEDRASDIIEKSPKIVTPKEPRIWPIPSTVIFNLVKRIAGNKAKYESYRKAELEWDQSYEDIVIAWESRCGYIAKGDARGSWSHTLTIALHEETRPATIASELIIPEDWEVHKSQFQRLVSTTGKTYVFTVSYIFKALALGTSSRATTVLSQAGSSIGRDSSFTSPTPFDGDSVTPTPRESVTTRREADLDLSQLTFGQLMLRIQKTNACRKCSGRTWCYVPVPGGKHLHLSGKSLTDWTQALMNGQCTQYQPPEDLPELVHWRKHNLVSKKSKKRRSKKSRRRRSPSTTTSESSSSDSAYAEVPQERQLPQESEVSRLQVLESSPPCESEDPYENIGFWINYAVDQHAHTQGFKPDTIVARCRSAYMTFRQIRDILKDAKLEPWSEVREFGIERGIAAVMHSELRPWEQYVKNSY